MRQAKYQQLSVEENLYAFGDWKFHMFPFFKILQEIEQLKNISEY